LKGATAISCLVVWSINQQTRVAVDGLIVAVYSMVHGTKELVKVPSTLQEALGAANEGLLRIEEKSL